MPSADAGRRRAGRPAVAIAHDYLTQRGGAERVVLDIARTFPGAPIHTTLYDPDATFPEFRDLEVIVSPLNRVGLLRRHHRLALPLLPLAAHTMRVDAEVVVVSSSGWAHGFSTGGAKIVYCHNPARWLYQTDEYLGSGSMAQVKRAVVAAVRAPLTAWDRRAAHSADVYLSNSTVVRDRIDAAYGIKADLLHPAAGVSPQGRQAEVPDLWEWAELGYNLVVSRLLPYKNIDQVLRAVEGTEERLVVVGRGPELPYLRRVAPPNAMLLHGLSDAQMRWLYAHATALLAPSREDFGLTPLEAGAFGKPVIALRAGGYLDTVVEGRTGEFFDVAVPDQIRAAIARARTRRWDVEAIEDHVASFSRERFSQAMLDLVHSVRQH
ncbi:glycosyltransferase [Ornithinimicrobium sediminis]|uniref:glycosyltransferase n=1 Tax=Ornithinimicrobium sediminis TaxID=2904603 RepID=UPI001E444272|nr:glycosyltransferase [Ornithinimicrobium sediminis]MCE0486870.1 glycosyltransferase [Ornithinimicrobium sediminis]